MRMLLSSVFGPFGVNDDYSREENVMELFHNQVTREQGLFSLRFNHQSFGLHFLAENVEIPTTVLDFPSQDRFREEVARGYDYVGISFIVPNLEKARRMAEIVREVSPTSQLLLGGHGTSIPGVEQRIPCDHICRGDGIGFLRRLLDEDPDRPIRHPVLHSSFNREVMGAPLPDGSAILIPGVGCANHCRFCATSHFFGGYTPYLPTGRSVFDACCAAEAELGVTDFGVLDDLLGERRHHRPGGGAEGRVPGPARVADTAEAAHRRRGPRLLCQGEVAVQALRAGARASREADPVPHRPRADPTRSERARRPRGQSAPVVQGTAPGPTP